MVVRRRPRHGCARGLVKLIRFLTRDRQAAGPPREPRELFPAVSNDRVGSPNVASDDGQSGSVLSSRRRGQSARLERSRRPPPPATRLTSCSRQSPIRGAQRIPRRQSLSIRQHRAQNRRRNRMRRGRAFHLPGLLDGGPGAFVTLQPPQQSPPLRARPRTTRAACETRKGHAELRRWRELRLESQGVTNSVRAAAPTICGGLARRATRTRASRDALSSCRSS